MQPNWGWDLFRNILSFLDSAGYALVSGVYNVFFTVANAQIFSGDILDEFFSRIQLILATIMIFSLAITALNIIINPDAFKDKQKGAGKIIMRVILSLVMLSLVVPINLPANSDNRNPLNEQISNNGILFGFLYQFQNSVMQDNILGKLVLGSNASSTTDGDLDSMSDIGGTLATTVARAFISPTLKDNSDDPDVNSDGITEDDVVCPDAINVYGYGDDNLSYKTLIQNINATCDADEGGEVYVFEYTPLLGLVCSIIMAVIILGFTIDVAVRAIKLALLRLIAPIPIISYIIPGQEKNGAFNNWVKTLTSTYIDLFLRIIIIYFGAYVILIISEGGINIWQNGPGFFTSLFATVFIIIGVLMFMKQAPKFFQDMFGLKGDGKLFSGIGTMLGAAALTGGLAGSVATGVRAGWQENKMANRPTWMGVGGAITSGLTSGIGGLVTGGRALATADKKAPSAVMSAMQKRNAMRAAHSTALGRLSSNAYGMFTGRTLAEKDKAILDASQEASKAISSWASDAQDEALKQTADSGYYGVAEINGTKYGFNWDQLEAAMAGADSNGNFYIGNQKFNRSDFTTETQNAIKKSQTAQYLSSVYDKTTGNFKNARLQTSWKMLKPKLDNANIDYSDLYAAEYDNATGQIIPNADPLPFLDPSKKGAALGKVQSQIEEYTNSLKHTKHIANHNNSKN